MKFFVLIAMYMALTGLQGCINSTLKLNNSVNNSSESGTLSSPTSVLNFHGKLPLSTSLKTVILTNSSDYSITLDTLESALTNPFGVGVGGTCATGTVLEVGDSCQLKIKFSPTALGNFSREISIPYTSEGKTKALVIDVIAHGTPHEFITVWETPAVPPFSISLPLDVAGTYNFTVDWGDGSSNTITAWNDAAATHTYVTAGTYTVTMSGVYSYVYVTSNLQQIKEVSNWGSNVWSSMHAAYSGCSNLRITALDAPDLSAVTDMSNMFTNATSFNDDINFWDVSNVTQMLAIFNGATSFNQPLDEWDMSNVTMVQGMFGNATAFNQNINTWDVSNIVHFQSMFFGATSFNQPLNNWNLASAVNTPRMFEGATAFNQDLSAWDTSNITFMAFMFQNATSFNQDLSEWDVSSVVTNTDFSNGATSWTLPKPIGPGF